MSGHDFSSPSVRDFLEALGTAGPTPGGGTSAAVAGAMGAALVRMLAGLTIGRKKYAEHEALMQAIAEQAAEEQQALLALAADDAAAFDGVTAAYRLPRETPAEQQARTRAVQEATKAACEVPLRVMQHCLEVISLARNAVTRGNRNAASDGAAGAELARAGLKIAAYNVKINLTSIEDADYVRTARTRLDEMTFMGMKTASAVDSFVEDLWQPSSAPGS
jgi:formiminotetrahydrofolate cyclodeaminase